MTKHLINEYYEVDDADASKSFAKGEKRTDYADAWKDTGNAILIGLKGSGKVALAELLAERTGMPIVTPTTSDEAVKTFGVEGQIVVLGDELVEDSLVQPLVHGAGKVFYLMADSNTLSDRVAGLEGIDDRETLWREMSARLATMEPIFYSTLHFILQAAQPLDDMVEDTLEKIAF